MFRRSLLSLARPTAAAASSSLLRAPAAFSFSAAAAAARPAVVVPSARFLHKISATPISQLKHDWADKGPIDFEGVSQLVEQNAPDVTILDVREYNEIEQGKIPNALGLPLSVLPEAIKLQPEDFERTYGFRKPKRDERVVVYCRSGKRSQSALEAMMEGPEVDNRFTNVRNYTGSWLDWSSKYQPKEEEDDDKQW